MGLFLQRIGGIKIMLCLFLQIIGRIKMMSSHFCKNIQKKRKKLFKIGFFTIVKKRVGYGEISNRLWL